MNAPGTNRGPSIAAGGRLVRFAHPLCWLKLRRRHHHILMNVDICLYCQVCCHYAYRFGSAYGGGYYGGSKPLYNPGISLVGDPWIWGSGSLQVHFHFAIN